MLDAVSSLLRPNIPFDTLKHEQLLRDAKFNEDQAEALTTANVGAFTEFSRNYKLSTKEDLLELKNDLKKTENKLISLIHANNWKLITMLSTIQAILLSVMPIIDHFITKF